MEQEELLRQIVAETQKGLEPLVKALAEIERAKPKDEVKLATREEVDRVMEAIDSNYRPTSKSESEKTDEEKMLDQICKLL